MMHYSRGTAMSLRKRLVATAGCSTAGSGDTIDVCLVCRQKPRASDRSWHHLTVLSRQQRQRPRLLESR